MSKIEVNAIEPQCGTNLTVGASGDTITFPSGTTVVNNGSQTGFGRTGTVDWDTTAKTASFTAVSGNGYFVNTTSGAVTVTLPATPSAGDIVAVADYAGTAATNNIIIARNGSNIEGGTDDARIYENRDAITLVYVDGTQGWVPVNNNEKSGILPPQYVAATGGTITTSGDYKIHTFTGPGTFTVTCAGNPVGSATVDYLVVAGGGSAGRACGNFGSGGGGGGGMRISGGTASGCYAVSPLGSSPSPVSALPVTAQGYPITIGGGGSPVSSDGPGNSGSNSVFSTITSAGGGAGGGGPGTPGNNIGVNGGSGGGANNVAAGGTGNTPPVSPPQGQPGATNPVNGGAGGGGAGQTGFNSDPSTSPRSGGGDGSYSNINPATGVADGPVGSARYYAGGGGGGCGAGSCHSGPGGAGGGGAGLFPFSSPAATIPGQAGTVNTGGGGGGTRAGNSGGGGSGIVIIRYKFQ